MEPKDLISYPLILRPSPNPCVRLFLPHDLTMKEVKRITAMLEAIAIDGPEPLGDVESVPEIDRMVGEFLRETAEP